MSEAASRAALERLCRAVPQLLADLRELRAEIRSRDCQRGEDPLASTCNDLAHMVMLEGGLNTLVAPQNSGRDPSPQRLEADWARWEASLAPRESSGAPIVVQHAGRRY